MMRQFVLVSVAAIFLSANLSAQYYPLIPDKQGVFQVVDWGVYTHYNCGFTKTETSANYQKLVSFINTIKKNTPVINQLKGFDLTTRIYAENCDAKFGYGIPCMINFEFAHWYTDKGKELCNHIEPPSWKIYINQPRRFHSFGYSAVYSGGDARPDFKKKEWEDAAKKTQELFYTSGTKETLAPGIDRYNGLDIIIYNPDRPAYWLPVTVREAFKLLLDYWRLYPEKIASDMSFKMLEEEYKSFTEEELDGYAYAGGKGAFAQIGNDESSPQLMKINPAYLNKNLPKSAIQFISFSIPTDQKYLETKANESKKKQIAFYETKFEAELDINQFTSLIDK